MYLLLVLPLSIMAQETAPNQGQKMSTEKTNAQPSAKVKIMQYGLPNIKGAKEAYVGNIYETNVAVQKNIVGESSSWWLEFSQKDGSVRISYEAVKEMNQALSELKQKFDSEVIADEKYIEQYVEIEGVKIGYVFNVYSKKIEDYWVLSSNNSVYIKLNAPDELQETLNLAISTIEAKKN